MPLHWHVSYFVRVRVVTREALQVDAKIQNSENSFCTRTRTSTRLVALGRGEAQSMCLFCVVGARRLPERVQPAVDRARGGAARVPARRAAAAALARAGHHLRQPAVRAPEAGGARGREQHERQPVVQGRHRPLPQPELRRRALTRGLHVLRVARTRTPAPRPRSALRILILSLSSSAYCMHTATSAPSAADRSALAAHSICSRFLRAPLSAACTICILSHVLYLRVPCVITALFTFRHCVDMYARTNILMLLASSASNVCALNLQFVDFTVGLANYNFFILTYTSSILRIMHDQIIGFNLTCFNFTRIIRLFVKLLRLICRLRNY